MYTGGYEECKCLVDAIKAFAHFQRSSMESGVCCHSVFMASCSPEPPWLSLSHQSAPLNICTHESSTALSA